MSKPKQIFVFEHGILEVGTSYNGIEFKVQHYELLSKYLTANPKKQLFTLYHRRVKFSQYVGVIQIADVVIEVLPKVDNKPQDFQMWQKVLFQMLVISLEIDAKTTTISHINLKRHTVLDAYVELFIHEVEHLLRQGLVKKYRSQARESKALKGKLLIHQNVTRNLAHAERFYISYSTYDHDNKFNQIISCALNCLVHICVSADIKQTCKGFQLRFPHVPNLPITEKLFGDLAFDRKTERYRGAIGLARVILLNFHPDAKGGPNNVLAIMFDMNRLWESYIFWSLIRAAATKSTKISVTRRTNMNFWKDPDEYIMRLVPDILLKLDDKTIVLDTKWKYRAETSIGDVRQLYAYGHYFDSPQKYLVYPDNLVSSHVVLKSGNFFEPMTKKLSDDNKCGLMLVDLMNGSVLDATVGNEILTTLQDSLLPK